MKHQSRWSDANMCGPSPDTWHAAPSRAQGSRLPARRLGVEARPGAQGASKTHNALSDGERAGGITGSHTDRLTNPHDKPPEKCDEPRVYGGGKLGGGFSGGPAMSTWRCTGMASETLTSRELMWTHASTGDLARYQVTPGVTHESRHTIQPTAECVR